VIIVTARGEPRDRVLGLRTGADDYVVKPFGMDELLARIDAVARRTRADRARTAPLGTATAGELSLDLDTRRATVAGSPLDLTRKEFDLLHLLVAHAGRVCTRSMILDQVWQAAYETPSRTLDVHIAALRTKLGRPAPVQIQTLRGVGYRLRSP
jgi:DNA-binding response OmpR family regulator